MGREIQRIGLGFLTKPDKRHGLKRSPRQWIGTWLERVGRRLQSGASPTKTLAIVRSKGS